MNYGIVGANGFIGSAFKRRLTLQDHDVREISYDFQGLTEIEFDYIIDANGNSKKYLATSDPKLDFNLTVSRLLDRLLGLRYKHYVYLSSGEVYGQTQFLHSTSEERYLGDVTTSSYGRHKQIAESLVKQYVTHPYIIRMGGFVGKGLKKNPIFDLLQGDAIRVHPDSRFQFIDVDLFSKIVIDALITLPVGTYNITGSGTISPSEIGHFLHKELAYGFTDCTPEHHELNIEKFFKLIGSRPPTSKDAVLKFLEQYGLSSGLRPND